MDFKTFVEYDSKPWELYTATFFILNNLTAAFTQTIYKRRFKNHFQAWGSVQLTALGDSLGTNLWYYSLPDNLTTDHDSAVGASGYPGLCYGYGAYKSSVGNYYEARPFIQNINVTLIFFQYAPGAGDSNPGQMLINLAENSVGYSTNAKLNFFLDVPVTEV